MNTRGTQAIKPVKEVAHPTISSSIAKAWEAVMAGWHHGSNGASGAPSISTAIRLQ